MTEEESLWKGLKADYNITEHLGSGTFGEVKKAIHKKSGRDVAIKLMKGVFKTEYESKRFLSEIELLRKLSTVEGNVFIVKIFDVIVPPDFNSTDDCPVDHVFIVMECVNQNLKEAVMENADV